MHFFFGLLSLYEKSLSLRISKKLADETSATPFSLDSDLRSSLQSQSKGLSVMKRFTSLFVAVVAIFVVSFASSAHAQCPGGVCQLGTPVTQTAIPNGTSYFATPAPMMLAYGQPTTVPQISAPFSTIGTSYFSSTAPVLTRFHSQGISSSIMNNGFTTTTQPTCANGTCRFAQPIATPTPQPTCANGKCQTRK